MKKIFLMILSLTTCFFLAGCGKSSEEKIIEQLQEKINDANSYHITGELEIINNEDSFLYNVETSYKEDDYFKVNLTNQTNNHQQIILKNEDGVYVLTPSLNKSFKFQSDWPYNNSQIYLLQTLAKDIENDDGKTIKETDNGYVITTKTNYSNNKNLTSQNIYMDKDLNITQIDVLNEEGLVEMKMKFSNIDYKPTFDDSYFSLEDNMNVATETPDEQQSEQPEENTEEQAESTGLIEDILFPMYIPLNTQLTSQDKISTENGERVILTFDGDESFMLIQEHATYNDEMVITPVSGEPVLFGGTIAVVADGSVNWNSNGMEYHLMSASLTETELVDIASSIGVLPVGK